MLYIYMCVCSLQTSLNSMAESSANWKLKCILMPLPFSFVLDCIAHCISLNVILVVTFICLTHFMHMKYLHVQNWYDLVLSFYTFTCVASAFVLIIC
jgi:peroxiredoxin